MLRMPCYDEGNDYDRYEYCRHPEGGRCAEGGGLYLKDEEKMYGLDCPLREAPKLDPGVLKWFRRPLSKEEKLGYLLEFLMPMLLEDIAKRDPETKELIIRNLMEIMSVERMNPEERPLCTMDREEAIKRGIEACTVKGDAQDGTGSEHLQ